jgi:hypothetical protein
VTLKSRPSNPKPTQYFEDCGEMHPPTSYGVPSYNSSHADVSYRTARRVVPYRHYPRNSISSISDPNRNRDHTPSIVSCRPQIVPEVSYNTVREKSITLSGENEDTIRTRTARMEY